MFTGTNVGRSTLIHWSAQIRRSDLIDSSVEFFMYLIEGLGSVDEEFDVVTGP